MEQQHPFSINQPFYLYQSPMFMLTVSVVLIMDNGVILLNNGNEFKFPSGMVKAGQETIQFAAVRHVKEQTGITLKKDILIPVDFRSTPERSKEGNLVDIGFVCMINHQDYKGTWKEVNFEDKKLVGNEKLYMDQDALLNRAIEVAWMIKE